MFIELHDDPDRIDLNDPDETHDVGVIQVFHQVCNSQSNTPLINNIYHFYDLLMPENESDRLFQALFSAFSERHLIHLMEKL